MSTFGPSTVGRYSHVAPSHPATRVLAVCQWCNGHGLVLASEGSSAVRQAVCVCVHPWKGCDSAASRAA